MRYRQMWMLVLVLCVAGCGESNDPVVSEHREIDLFSSDGQALTADVDVDLFVVHAVGSNGARVRLSTGATHDEVAELMSRVATEGTRLEVRALADDDMTLDFAPGVILPPDTRGSFRAQRRVSPAGAACAVPLSGFVR